MVSKKEIENKKNEIIEMYGLFMEKQENLTPIAARIFTTILLSKKQEDITFENLVLLLKASKSTVSTNLKLLIQSGYIEIYTKTGDRKKYYRLLNESFLIRIEKQLVMYEMEFKMLKQVVQFRNDANRAIENIEDQYKITQSSKYVEHLSKMIEKFREFKANLERELKV